MTSVSYVYRSNPDISHLKVSYLILHIVGGQIGYFFSSRIHRHPTLVNLWITCVIYSLSYCLLIYSGKSGTEQWYPQPSMVCRAQSALIHGTPPMSAVAGLVVVMQTWLTFNKPKKQVTSSSKRWPMSKGLIASLALPYLVFAVFVAISAMVGQNHLKAMTASNFLYCTLELNLFTRFGIPAFCSVIMLILIIFESAILFRFFQRQKHIHDAFPLAERRYSTALTYRVLLFNLCSIMVFSAGIFFISDNLDPYPFMVQAALPLAAVLVFGSQRDFFQVWCFWRRPNKALPAEKYLSHTLRRDTSMDSWNTSSETLPIPPRVHLKDTV